MGKRILVADDSLTIQQAIAMVMDGAGYSLSFAKSVDEALVVAKKDGRPDLVLADVSLGNGSGYDLCAELKADGAMRDVPVFVLASTQSPYDEARGRKVGADGYMAKPFESQALLDAVASALITPVQRPASAALPELADHDDNTARISASDLPSEDDDSYGEITIERGPAATPAAPAWSVKSPTRQSGARPLPAMPTPAVPAAPSPRPSLIPGARPSASMPAIPTGNTPQPAAQAPPASAAARPAMSRTMMGFPSVKPPVAAPKPQAPAAVPVVPHPTPAVPFPVVGPASGPVRVGPASVAAAVPSAPVRSPLMGTPAAPAVPVAPKLPSPAMPTPAAPAAARPIPSRFVPPVVSPVFPPVFPPVVPPVLPPPATAPITRKAPTPVPSSGPVVPPAFAVGASPVLPAAVTSAVEQKLAVLAARGPEYEAIAKLSREIIEQVVWEVVPELAEAIIRQEIDRLAAAKK